MGLVTLVALLSACTLICYSKQEQADSVIDKLLKEKVSKNLGFGNQPDIDYLQDPVLQYGGVQSRPPPSPVSTLGRLRTRTSGRLLLLC